jgi:hypothetical protein
MSLCYGCLTRKLSNGTPHHPRRLKSGHYPNGDRLAVADDFLHEPRLLSPELERVMAARHTHRQLQQQLWSAGLTAQAGRNRWKVVQRHGNGLSSVAAVRKRPTWASQIERELPKLAMN